MRKRSCRFPTDSQKNQIIRIRERAMGRKEHDGTPTMFRKIFVLDSEQPLTRCHQGSSTGPLLLLRALPPASACVDISELMRIVVVSRRRALAKHMPPVALQ
jgi:hypothetical protein